MAVDGTLGVSLGLAENPVQAVRGTTDTDGPASALAYDTALQYLRASPDYARCVDRGCLLYTSRCV